MCEQKSPFSEYLSCTDLPFFDDIKYEGIVELRDTFLFSRSEHLTEFDAATFSRSRLPDWVNFFEILRIGDAAASPPRDADDYHSQKEPSLGGSITRSLHAGGGIERPTFGRRMLIASFVDDLTDRDVARSDVNLRRLLGHSATGVWHGRDMTAYCFLDARSVDQINLGLMGTIDEHVEDYTLVEPLEVLVGDASGVSPLSHWVESGFRSSRQNPSGPKTST